jgi:hypothetical protein
VRLPIGMCCTPGRWPSSPVSSCSSRTSSNTRGFCSSRRRLTSWGGRVACCGIRVLDRRRGARGASESSVDSPSAHPDHPPVDRHAPRRHRPETAHLRPAGDLGRSG